MPHGHWKTTTLVAGLRLGGMTAPMVIDGAKNGEAFTAYAEHLLAPTLGSGDNVVTENLLAQGCRVFSFTYHSPSLAPGNTPYVRDRRDLDEFLQRLDRYFDYFINQLGGRPVTATELHGLLSSGG